MTYVPQESNDEKKAQVQDYFEVVRRTDGHLESFSNNFILLKGRKL